MIFSPHHAVIPFMSQALSDQLVSDIRRHIAARKLPAGTRLTERALSDQFRVSRSPVRDALRKLVELGVIENSPGKGCVVASHEPAAASLPADDPQPTDTERVYLAIAEDRVAGDLTDRVTENELMRRYGVTRATLAAILRRMVHEGWIQRMPGHGWLFLPMLSSLSAYKQSYRYRLLVEPAAMLEPDFKVNREALLACRAEQAMLVEGAVDTASPAQLFDANTHLHETIAAGSGNVFIADSLTRINRVRRLFEYRKAVDREQALRRCQEHLVLIDLLLNGQVEAAADHMRLHLRSAVHDKTQT